MLQNTNEQETCFGMLLKMETDTVYNRTQLQVKFLDRVTAGLTQLVTITGCHSPKLCPLDAQSHSVLPPQGVPQPNSTSCYSLYR